MSQQAGSYAKRGTRSFRILPALARSLSDDVRQLAIPLSIVLLPAIVAVVLSNKATRRIVISYPEFGMLAFAPVLLFCLIFSVLKYPKWSRGANCVLIGLACAIGLNGLWLGNELGNTRGAEGLALLSALDFGRYFLIPAVFLAFLRPSFTLFPFFYVIFHKQLTTSVSGGVVAANHIQPLLDVGVFLSVGVVMISLLNKLALFSQSSKTYLGLSEISLQKTGFLLMIAAIGAHFGNYFVSGLAKVLLPDGPLQWVTENPTSALMLGGFNLGANPLSFDPAVFAAVYSLFRAVEIPVNFFVLAAQLFCFLAFFNRKCLIGITLFFDVMHISIFLLTGAFFMHWIVLNTLIVLALQRDKGVSISALAVLTGVIFTIFGHHVFYNARLGWFDSRQVRYGYVVAFTASGDEVRVPNSFFRDASYTFYITHFGYRGSTQPSPHMLSSQWGQIGAWTEKKPGHSYSAAELMRLGKSCAFESVFPETRVDYDAVAVADFLRAQHARAMRYEDTWIFENFHLFPHAHFSMPWLFKDFEELELDEIVAYQYITETVCLSVEDGEFQRNVLVRQRGPKVDVRD